MFSAGNTGSSSCCGQLVVSARLGSPRTVRSGMGYPGVSKRCSSSREGAVKGDRAEDDEAVGAPVGPVLAA
jgi:hypothetical protein